MRAYALIAVLTLTPALLPAGMMGDRAAVIFSAPEEIMKFIERRC